MLRVPIRLARPALGALATLFIAGSFALASGPPSAGAATTPSGKGPLSAFQTCLAQHGVKFQARGFGAGRPGGGPPAGTSGGGGFPGTGSRPPGGFNGGFKANSKQAKAFAACRSKLPSGGSAGRQFTPTAAQRQALTTFEQCMAAHGVKIAPNASFQTIRSLMSADPSAANACRSDLNGAFGPPGGGRGGGASPSSKPS